MRITCIGGGPAGLYFALLMKQQDPRQRGHADRAQRADDTFGWGVVFSDQTLGALQQADPKTRRRRSSTPSTTGTTSTSTSRAARSAPSATASAASAASGCSTSCRTAAPSSACSCASRPTARTTRDIDADLIIAADGLNSRIRTKYAATYQPDIDLRRCRFVWLGTHKLFDAFTFAFEKTEWGWFQAHAYRFDDDTSTFIVEAPEEVWRAAGLEEMSKEEGIAFCEKLFAKYLDGHALMSNAAHLRGSAQWIRFPRVVCRRWVHHNGRAPVVLMGDAAHTAHFSIGSGTKLALEDAIDLAGAHRRAPGRPGGRAGRVRGAAQRRGAEDPERGAQLDRVVRERRALREARARAVRLFAADALAAHLAREPARCATPATSASVEGWLAAARGPGRRSRVPPMFTPFTLRGADAEEPRRRLADGAVQRGATACRATTTSCTWARARWAAPAWCSPR